MLQAVVKKGQVFAKNVPAPNVSKDGLLIKVVSSCISTGTEMSNVTKSERSLIQIAIDQPEKIKKGLDLLKTKGIKATYDEIKWSKQSGTPTGYSLSGVIIGVGENVKGFKPGDKVAAAGAGIANHAEYVDVPANLVMKMPEGLEFQEASTVTLGGIAMQGVRRADLRFGEFAVVVGAGILGILSIQILIASGVRVIAVDINQDRLNTAKEVGSEAIIDPLNDDQVKLIMNLTGGFGADAVLFTAATQSNDPLSDAFKSCKRKGRVILVGVSGMEIKRADIYPKEIDFLISTSYGPGRYDKNYEEKGIDYPYAYVRWTEKRNMSEYLRMLNSGEISVSPYIGAICSIEDVQKAFQSVKNPVGNQLFILLDYGQPKEEQLEKLLNHDRKIELITINQPNNKIKIGMIGVGNFATGVHLPNIEKLSDYASIYAIANRTGLKATNVAKQYGAKYATSKMEDLIADPDIDLIFISTRHDSHASLVLKALKAGKHIFVEKPLAINSDELKPIKEFYNSEGEKPILMVGFNRRFSPFAQEIKKHTSKRINPLFIHYRMNAGYLPAEHWVHEQGGRLVGEACHLIDLMTFFTESEIESISSESLTPKTTYFNDADNKSIILKYKDGSVCTIEYFATGSKEFPKEYMEVHFDEKSIVLDDYKSLKGYGVKVNEITASESNKGQKEELEILFSSLKSGKSEWPIELWDMVQTTEISFLI